MVFTFNTTLPATNEEEELTDRKEIALAYLKTWFSIELMAIIPVDGILSVLLGYPCLCGAGTCFDMKEN